MKDKQSSDKIESLVDAFLSWTIQCCDTDKVARYNNLYFMIISRK